MNLRSQLFQSREMSFHYKTGWCEMEVDLSLGNTFEMPRRVLHDVWYTVSTWCNGAPHQSNDRASSIFCIIRNFSSKFNTMSIDIVRTAAFSTIITATIWRKYSGPLSCERKETHLPILDKGVPIAFKSSAPNIQRKIRSCANLVRTQSPYNDMFCGAALMMTQIALFALGFCKLKRHQFTAV